MTVSSPDLTGLLEQFLAYRPHYALFLLVHPQVGRLMTAVEEVQQQYAEWPHLALNRSLAPLLREVVPAQWPRMMPRLLAEALQQYGPGPLLCSEIDLLFEPRLLLNPLGLFLEAGRHTSLIIAWPGTCDNGSVAYGVPEHAHYRAWPRAELCDYCVVRL